MTPWWGSADRRLVLDGDPYPLLSGIRHNIARLKFDSFEVWHDTRRSKGEARALSIEEAREKCTIRVQELRREVEALRRRLFEDYRKTYQ